MSIYTTKLWKLTSRMLTNFKLVELRAITQVHQLDCTQLEEFDLQLGGPSFSVLTGKDGNGRYTAGDREIFRPLQYCGMFLKHRQPEWFTRGTVHMSGLHLESLIKRIGRFGRITLGEALSRQFVQRKLDAVTYQQISAFKVIYNAAKHDVDQSKDTHLFSIEDAVLAYIISRYLGMRLYPLASLTTIWSDRQLCHE